MGIDRVILNKENTDKDPLSNFKQQKGSEAM